MAIQPVDLQLAYLAAPQNAAIANNAQTAPQVAQAAAQSAFAAETVKREETIAESSQLEGSTIRTDRDRGGDQDGYAPRKRRRQGRGFADDPETPQLSSDGEQHFIDTIA
jgi:hypothetical protein